MGDATTLIGLASINFILVISVIFSIWFMATSFFFGQPQFMDILLFFIVVVTNSIVLLGQFVLNVSSELLLNMSGFIQITAPSNLACVALVA